MKAIVDMIEYDYLISPHDEVTHIYQPKRLAFISEGTSLYKVTDNVKEPVTHDIDNIGTIFYVDFTNMGFGINSANKMPLINLKSRVDQYRLKKLQEVFHSDDKLFWTMLNTVLRRPAPKNKL